MTAEEAARLVVDAMLGRLARWLRALGYDTRYDANWDDVSLARLARAEGRLLLTRDRQLAARKGLHSLLVQSDDLGQQLAEVLGRLGPPTAGAFGRCVICNVTLSELDRASVEGRVPEYVWETHEEFFLCRNCGRIYWRGTHWQQMVKRLRHLDGDDGEDAHRR